VQTARNYLLRGPSYTAVKSPLAVMQIFATFEYEVNLNNNVRLLDPKNRGVGKHSAQLLSFTGTELYRFEVPIVRNANFQNLGVK